MTPKHRNIDKLIAAYQAIEQYQNDHDGVFPSFSDLVNAGVASSRSVVQYYMREMHTLGMVKRVKGIARSSRLLPLEDADEVVKKYLAAQ